MLTFEDLQSKKEKIAIVGLGYVGLPLAALLSKRFAVLGLDINKEKIAELKNNIDRTNEIGAEGLKQCAIDFTDDQNRLKEAKFIIMAIPTPVDANNKPDLFLVEKATEMVGKNLAPGSIVVYESTVYPGVTEDICLPILEKESGLKGGVDFKIGYSPERVNPGDKEHTIDRIVKVVSGMDEESLNVIDQVYGSITTGGTFRAASIKAAEAAKVIENTQRDLNIALMNELAVIFNKMDLSIYDVLAAAGTKWNFLKFTPGLVGGHCIGVDPYYLTYIAERLGYDPQVIASGRRMNDNMAGYMAKNILQVMEQNNSDFKNNKVAILGMTFKENVPDTRNSKVFDLYKTLLEAGIKSLVYDPEANKQEVKHEYGIDLCVLEELKDINTVIVAVSHNEFKNMSAEDCKKIMANENLLVADIKHILNKSEFVKLGINYWSL